MVLEAGVGSETWSGKNTYVERDKSGTKHNTMKQTGNTKSDNRAMRKAREEQRISDDGRERSEGESGDGDDKKAKWVYGYRGGLKDGYTARGLSAPWRQVRS